jgi:hypothetical protein
MKIYLLVCLIGLIVGFSHFPIRSDEKETAPVPPDSMPA